MFEPSIAPLLRQSQPRHTAYRIAHVADPRKYWTGTVWGKRPEARLYSADEREAAVLPLRGCWERLEDVWPISFGATSAVGFLAAFYLGVVVGFFSAKGGLL